MAQVISATDKFVDNAGHKPSGKRQRFLTQAYDLLDRARRAAAAEDYAEALELSYQAALRTAGAWVAGTRVAQRKRLPSSAWERLSLVGGPAKAWAEKLRGYSRTRSRVMIGLDDGVDPDLVFELLAVVGQFLAVVDDAASPAAA